MGPHTLAVALLLFVTRTGASEVPQSNGGEPPMATTVVRERGKFAITCKVPMTHVPLWLKDGVPVAQSQGYHLEQEYPFPVSNGSVSHIFMRLSVERAHLSHAGHYKCSSFSPHAHRIVVVAGKAPQAVTVAVTRDREEVFDTLRRGVSLFFLE
uniref:Putative secreted protein n=1 Tax=Amblyomma cajennense TaxID=34607 RepID=A0A023FCQ2_AMBCJ